MVARKVAQSEIYSAVGWEFGMVAAMVAMLGLILAVMLADQSDVYKVGLMVGD